MQTYLFASLLIVWGSAGFISCKKYLDVQPQDKFLSEQVFSTEQGAYSALNGIYINIATPALYGGNMTMSYLDVLAQYYYYDQSKTKWLQYADYSYDDAGVKGTFSSIWSAAYQAILNDNTFIAEIKKSPAPIEAQQKDILAGEAYAMRAYLHFDILRIFGPVYSKDSSKSAIPYFNEATDKIQPILPANVVVDSILKDLNQALILLKNDPVRTEGVAKQSGMDPSADFYKIRNRRFNYYAALAIKARVLLYRNDKVNALLAAKSVIQEAGKWFPWSPGGSSLPGIPSPDRNFSSEIILGVQNYDMYTQQKALFASALTPDMILIPTSERLNEVFENQLNDYRFRVNWAVDLSSTYSDKTFIKYQEVADDSAAFRNFQPMLRMSELFYIAAECEPNPAQSLNYLNTVRKNRGLPDLTSTANIEVEIQKEYRKEFWGEGQTFFYFKRKAIATIPAGNSVASIQLDAQQYVVPLPLVETQNR